MLELLRKFMQKFEVIIVGGGLVGCAFALDLALQNNKINIAVLELKPYLQPDLSKLDSKIYAISPENVKYLKKIGVWSDESRVGEIKSMDVKGDEKGNIYFDFKGSKHQYLAKTIEYNNLQHQLYTKLGEITNVSFIYDDIKNIEYLDLHAKLTGKNDSYTARLVVGADGANSFVRKSADIEMKLISYPEYGVVANFNCENPHMGIASQWFIDGGEVLAYLPLSNNRISIVWSTKKHQYLTNLPDNEFEKLVEDAGENKLGKLTLITKPVAFPLKLYLLDKVYAHKMVLIGDAAHTIHPLAGQGVNLGFSDAKLLAEILSNVQDYQIGDIAVLARFNSARLINVKKMQFTCHMLYRLFKSNSPILKHVRNTGLNLVNSLPLVKKYLIKQAITY